MHLKSETFLRVPLESARVELKERLRIGGEIEIKLKLMLAESQFEKHEEAYYIWSNYNKSLLGKKIFTDRTISDEYSFSSIEVVSIRGVNEFEKRRNRVIERIRNEMKFLRSVISQLEFYDEQLEPKTGGGHEVSNNKKVFIVHGRDELAKYKVSDFLSKRSLEPLILHELPGRGRTVIEKIEEHSEVGFAIILITPDDVGTLQEEFKTIGVTSLKPRARQNVILELGYFIAKLGRENVAVLLSGEVEKPSDIDGIIYISLSDRGWETDIIKELNSAGYNVRV
ncbi:TIR domain-containing protein [Tumebacillus permanentifrigoris]|uniref:Putative nucleotide-binding protein with TIR-like domain n=1 Tax=Tumebacillus permanentifrigoris TaxID=378543 RepID=A0A316DZL3_9BACL|nr:nucleotide-binding protein [Tumebacillus permanentifrigoris]PWK15970.1 putative nucleotide-binding protein with TIR-like domain [Tumebacillus permanentifrigoris]